MAACYSLHGLARLSSTGAVLIHGGLSTNARAAIACVRAIEARIVTTAVDSSEALLLKGQRGIPASNVLVLRHSFTRRLPRDVCAGGLDAAIQATEDTIPSEVLDFLKPFGCVVAVSLSINTRPSALALPFKLPSNASFYSCDIVGLLAARPDMTAGLMTQTICAFNHISMRGLDISVRGVEDASDALQLLGTGSCPQVVLQAGENSVVPVMKMQTIPDCWQAGNTTYVVSGGLGDLGRRILPLVARRGAKSLVTLSRRVVDRETHRDLQAQLEAAQPGCRLSCVQCDITSDESLKEAADSLVRMGLPPVRGMVQYAVVLRVCFAPYEPFEVYTLLQLQQDCTVEKITYDGLSLAIRIKIGDTLALYHALASRDLDFFITLSSAANIIGTSGQSNYNAGNAAKDILAQAHHDALCYFVALDIGWVEDAVATADHGTRVSAVRRVGLKEITHEQLSRFPDYALGASSGRR